MSERSPFKWRHVQADSILGAVRGSLRYAVSDRAVEELLEERGVRVDHTPVFRWGQHDAPALDKRCRPQRNVTTDAYRVDEPSIQMKKPWSDR